MLHGGANKADFPAKCLPASFLGTAVNNILEACERRPRYWIEARSRSLARRNSATTRPVKYWTMTSNAPKMEKFCRAAVHLRSRVRIVSKYKLSIAPSSGPPPS